ncbi:MAG: hypothetical protein HBSIN02_18890 [Bacteroidia bacterium]|nr:MAG: hypothetical protein HBSIN02_18890 [Bacteroidia bacterium]
MGRTSILMVMGFNVIFALMGFSLSRVSEEAVKNYSLYYTNAAVHNIAASAANIAANQIFFTPNWREGYSNVPFAGGTYSVQVKDLPNRRIQITARATTQGPDETTGAYENKEATIIIVMQPSSFSKFAYYSVVEGGIYWITGDTVWGPFHTQSKLSVSGNPVFYGKVTAKNGLFKSPSSSKPKFYGGFQSGVSINLPSDMNPLEGAAQSGGRYFTSGAEVSLTFNADGTVTWKEGGNPAVTEPLSTFSPNGVIFAKNTNIRIKGTLKGRVTISATGSSGAAKGNVYLDDNIVYSTDPNDPNCDDMLGIAVDNDVIITDNAANNNSINVHASIFCRTGGFTAQNYNTRPVAGTINLVGGIQQYQRGPVGTFSGGTINHGFQKNYRYDMRLMTDLPPFYPTTGSYEILSWYE